MFKSPFRIFLLFFALLLVAAAITNPSQEQFQNKVRETIEKEYEEEMNSPVFKDIAKESFNFISQLLEKFVKRSNFFICSVYTVDMPIGEYKYLGIFGTFVPLQKENPITEFKKY
jgi:hypothetical protein